MRLNNVDHAPVLPLPESSPSPHPKQARSGPREHSELSQTNAPSNPERSEDGSVLRYSRVASMGDGGDPIAITPRTTFDDEAAALQCGLLPLNANEEDDYGGADDVTRKVALCFLQRDFRYVSEVEGGFVAHHQRRAHFLASELVNHSPELCMVCSGGRAASSYPAMRESDNSGPDLSQSPARSIHHIEATSRRRIAPAAHGPRGHLFQSASGEKAAQNPHSVSAGAAAVAAGQWLAAMVAVPESSQLPSALSQRAVSDPLIGSGRTAIAQLSSSPREQSLASFIESSGTASASDLLFDGIDDHGLPLLSEQAHLDIQCDMIERTCEAETGHAVIPSSMAHKKRAASKRRIVQNRVDRVAVVSSDPSSEVVYVEDMLFSAAAKTASVLQRLVSPPPPSSALESCERDHHTGVVKTLSSDIVSTKAVPGSHDVPTLSLTDFVSHSGGTSDSPRTAMPADVFGVNSVANDMDATQHLKMTALPSVPPLPPARQRTLSTANIVNFFTASLSPPPASTVAVPKAKSLIVPPSLPAPVDGLPSAQTLCASTPGLPTGKVTITPANSRYLDTIRRAALSGLESLQPPKK